LLAQGKKLILQRFNQIGLRENPHIRHNKDPVQKPRHQWCMLSAQEAPCRMVLTEQVQGGVVESQRCSIDCGGKSADGSGLYLGVKLKIFLRFFFR